MCEQAWHCVLTPFPLLTTIAIASYNGVGGQIAPNNNNVIRLRERSGEMLNFAATRSARRQNSHGREIRTYKTARERWHYRPR